MQNNFNVSPVLIVSELGVWDSINGANVKGDCVIGGREGRKNRRGNYGTSANSSSHVE